MPEASNEMVSFWDPAPSGALPGPGNDSTGVADRGAVATKCEIRERGFDGTGAACVDDKAGFLVAKQPTLVLSLERPAVLKERDRFSLGPMRGMAGRCPWTGLVVSRHLEGEI